MMSVIGTWVRDSIGRYVARQSHNDDLHELGCGLYNLQRIHDSGLSIGRLELRECGVDGVDIPTRSYLA